MIINYIYSGILGFPEEKPYSERPIHKLNIKHCVRFNEINSLF